MELSIVTHAVSGQGEGLEMNHARQTRQARDPVVLKQNIGRAKQSMTLLKQSSLGARKHMIKGSKGRE
jgi:hypothetical protein